MKCGIAGIGLLGGALTQQLVSAGVHVCSYHPDSQRRTKFASEFKDVKAVGFSELLKQPTLLLAIPADAIRPFLRDAEKEISPNNTQPTFVNLSTLTNTEKLRTEFPNLQIYGVKMIGHSKYLYENGDGVFVTETSLEAEGFQEIRSLFDKIGTIFEDNESVVREVNGLAVRKIIEACINFEKETKDFPSAYSQKAMDTIFPNTMKLYREGTFDGFMLKIMDEINQGNTK